MCESKPLINLPECQVQLSDNALSCDLSILRGGATVCVRACVCMHSAQKFPVHSKSPLVAFLFSLHVFFCTVTNEGLFTASLSVVAKSALTWIPCN